jgi:hypothetical protein
VKHLGCMMENWNGRKSKDDFCMELELEKLWI